MWTFWNTMVILDMRREMSDMWRIWIQMFKDGEHVGSMVSAKSYVRRGNAQREANKIESWDGAIKYKCVVSEENPWRENE